MSVGLKGRIDVHHHFFPSRLNIIKSDFSEELGYTTPPENLPWTPEKSITMMDKCGIQFAILSMPALNVTGNNSEQARSDNVAISDICAKRPDRLGWFAALPNLDYTEDALDEIAYSLDVLGADGIGLPSSCGIGKDAKYLGHASYEPVWAELNRRSAVVFVHGTQNASVTPHPHPVWLGLPVVEVPNETYKAAASLVVSGFKHTYPDVKIILSHMGGSTAVLSSRCAVLASYMGCSFSPEEIIEDFRTFYFDTALGGGVGLATLQHFLGDSAKDRILFGTDFPAVTKGVTEWFTTEVERYCGSLNEGDSRIEAIVRGNALKLFPRLEKLDMEMSSLSGRVGVKL